MGKIFSDPIQQYMQCDWFCDIKSVPLTNDYDANDADRTAKNAFRKYMYTTLGHNVHLQ